MRTTILENREFGSRRTAIRTLAVGLVVTIAAGRTSAVGEELVVAPMKNPAGYEYFIGIVGNPSSPDISWSDDELTQIKALGVNMVQLSIAWGGKPANEGSSRFSARSR